MTALFRWMPRAINAAVVALNRLHAALPARAVLTPCAAQALAAALGLST